MKKINDLFNHIDSLKNECDKLNNALRSKYTEYEDLLTQLEPEGESAQLLIEDMGQIRDTIDSLDLVMKSLETACYHADDAQWAIKNLNIKDWTA